MQLKSIREFISKVGKGSNDFNAVSKALEGLNEATATTMLSYTSLTNAEKIQILTSNGVKEAAAMEALGITSVGTASATAATGVSGLGAALKGLSFPFQLK